MKYSKIGTELAYALLMSSFDTINEEPKMPSVRKSIVQYVADHTICPQKIAAATPNIGITNAFYRNSRESKSAVSHSSRT